MEGLLIAEQLRALAPLLPAERGAWRFPDDRTAILPLAGRALWLGSRPPRPYVRLEAGGGARGGGGAAKARQAEAPRPLTPFQQQLVARAVGPLVAFTQAGRDRVFTLTFGPSSGFVPVPGIDLVVELTGRNANLVLVEDGRIVGVERQILADRNRYRELRVGAAYRPPPPYRKTDPVAASAPELAAALAGRAAGKLGAALDGIGPELGGALTAALAARGVMRETELSGEALAVATALVAELAAAPGAFLARWGGAPVPAGAADDEGMAPARARLARLLAKELELAKRKVADAEASIRSGAGADELRAQADLLLARSAEVPPGAARVKLVDFAGAPVELALDPRLGAAANAAARYDQARRRAARAERAAASLAGLEAAAAAAEAELAGVPDLPAPSVHARLAALAPREGKGKSKADVPGIRFSGPHGFEVVVGRNARDNDRVTFQVARSRDLWLHAQGYRGSHVVVRSGGAEVPFETVLFAARLAAGFSEARREDKVAVDYTERKNVWRPKGAAPGAVNFAHHRTVVVSPARDDEGAAGRGR